MSHIAIISSGQPSANPRLVKEAVAIAAAGFQVTVIYCPLSPWADPFDEQLFQQHSNISWIKSGYHHSYEKFKYEMVRLRRKFNEFLFQRFPFIPVAADYSMALFGPELIAKAKSIKADLYIAHNLAALPAAHKAAAKWSSTYAFDAEDFHRGEDREGSRQWKLALAIEGRYLPGTRYISAASPLIEKAYKNLFYPISTLTINNVFPIAYLQQRQQMRVSNGDLKMFWFSQSIGKNRGIEDVIRAMGLLKNRNVQLSLLGTISKNHKEYFLQLIKENNLKDNQVVFLAPVKEAHLAVIGAQHDIGLALEVPENVNRQLCLTNKIFLYLLAGNGIIFSDTPAQRLFLEENKGIGSLIKSGSAEDLAKTISLYIDNPATLSEHQLQASSLAVRKMNWEMESKVLVQKIHEVLN